jgi:hypothetical protein
MLGRDLAGAELMSKLANSEDYWHRLSAHAGARLAAGCPWSVQTYLATLVGPHEISGCFPQYSMTEASTDWAITAVTDDGRIILLHMTFNQSHHDFDGEQIAQRQRNPATFVVHRASVRKLAEAVQLDIRKVHGRPDGFGQLSRQEFSIGDISLTFRDGEVIDLAIDQTGMYDDGDLARTDALIDAVRAHSEL